MTAAEQTVVFENVADRAVLSINRGFSAPVTVETNRTPSDLAFLSAHDDDPFARYEAMQQLMLDTLVGAIAGGTPDHAPVIAAIRNTLADPALDKAFVAEAVLLPSEGFIGDHMLVVDPDAIHTAREALRREIERIRSTELAEVARWRWAISPPAMRRMQRRWHSGSLKRRTI